LFAEVRLIEARQASDPATLTQVLDLLTHLLNTMQTAGLTTGVIEIHILQALALDAVGEQEAALAALQTALKLAQPGSFIRMFSRYGRPLQTLLLQVEYDDLTYVHRLLAAFPDALATDTAADHPYADLLTDRERDVLNGLAAGLSNKEIESKLFISRNTVRTHLKNLYSKLNVDNRTQAVVRAQKLGILS
jgi:LuxR family maltose regulon positive regulatory protein